MNDILLMFCIRYSPHLIHDEYMRGWRTADMNHKKRINIMKLNKLSIAALAIAALANPSYAALAIGDIISINFAANGQTTASGAAVIGTGSDTWNNLQGNAGSNVSGLGTQALSLTSGSTSSASLEVSTGYFNGSATNPSNIDLYEGNIYLDSQGQFGPSGPSTITFSGLGAGTIVDLYFYIGAGHTSGEGGAITIGSTSFSANDANVIESAFTLGTNYVKFDDIVADNSGNITATWSVSSGQRFTSLAGIQLTAVPETSTTLLGGLGALALLRRRRA